MCRANLCMDGLKAMTILIIIQSQEWLLLPHAIEQTKSLGYIYKDLSAITVLLGAK